MNVEIEAEAAQFPEKEYINGIAFAVQVEITLFKISTELLRDRMKFSAGILSIFTWECSSNIRIILPGG
jgi:hypothetical protein